MRNSISWFLEPEIGFRPCELPAIFSTVQFRLHRLTFSLNNAKDRFFVSWFVGRTTNTHFCRYLDKNILLSWVSSLAQSTWADLSAIWQILNSILSFEASRAVPTAGTRDQRDIPSSRLCLEWNKDLSCSCLDQIRCDWVVMGRSASMVCSVSSHKTKYIQVHLFCSLHLFSWCLCCY